MAWAVEKDSAKQSQPRPRRRILWLEVGNALNVGRYQNPGDQKFSQWCKANGFGDIKPDIRTAAMWVAANWSVVTTDLPQSISHPINMVVSQRVV